ncbi:helix-turn-helix domain-containing protein [Lacticaseibacillus suilingensis]|uniref:Helix-turn-helix domain-containing protein n=1 Tax=Lacticaseibacillus suilingensis TaxID=2799577 RepID=A0ABW4BFD6_9LACO|nr:helix-turn-helix transcriptional regulator [Lacticaseibacillus suilingensis]
MTTGERISKLRKERSLTQPMLANQLNVSQSTITSWENDRRTISNDDLKQLADFFHVTTDYILGLTDTRIPAGNKSAVDLADKNVIMSFEGRPIPPEDIELMRRLLRGSKKDDE